MFSSKRVDKYTTGLINTRNDCFANSSLQAFAALPGLATYLNGVHRQHQLVTSLPLPQTEDQIPALPLHDALADIVKQLQEPIQAARYLSVWPFLQVIEKIYNSRISANQNDAQELVQLILETLGSERKKFKKFVKKSSLNVVIPDLPFDGLLADQLTCYSCLNSSRPSFHPFSVMSLPVPQQKACTLQEMLSSNEMETINGYHCLRCKVKGILKVEAQKLARGEHVSDEHSQLVSKLKTMERNLTINDDLDKELDEFVKNYNSEGFCTENLLSTIVKKTIIVKPPSLLTLHLSRSMFVANHITRNGCHVEYEESLDIRVDESLAQEYEIRKKAGRKGNSNPLVNGEPHSDANSMVLEACVLDDDDDDDVVEGYDDDRYEPDQLKKIHSEMLSQHGEKETSEHIDHVDHVADEDSVDVERSASSEDSVNSNSDDLPGNEGSLTSDEEYDQGTLNLIKGNAHYRLRAVIRHQGTHSAGHYECYRHKPNLVKDTNGTVIDLSPKIRWKTGSDDDERIAPIEQRKSSSPLNHATPEIPQSPSGSPALGSDNGASEDDSSNFSRFKSRLGGLVSRRSSSNSSPAGSSRPLFTGDTCPPATFEDLTHQAEQLNVTKHKYKKFPSVVKYPFWRISDSNVSEVKKADVLKERCAVYMIYYEMVHDW